MLDRAKAANVAVNSRNALLDRRQVPHLTASTTIAINERRAI
jgi:hypothetical protein